MDFLAVIARNDMVLLLHSLEVTARNDRALLLRSLEVIARNDMAPLRQRHLLLHTVLWEYVKDLPNLV